MFSRPATKELEIWRYGLFAVAVSWFFAANFGPLSYAFPNALLWLLAGVVLAPRMVENQPDGEREAADLRPTMTEPDVVTT